AENIFYFGYDEKAYTLQQILHGIGKQVFKKFEFAKFQAMGLGAQRGKLADALRAQAFALVLDNLESVTGEALAIQNTLTAEEQGEIREFLGLLVGGRTKVVLGSRSGENWLADVFKENVYRLRGLDGESRTVLAEKILERAVGDTDKIAALRETQDFERLMGLLDGYPLAMEVVLANLARQSAEEVLAGLDAADVRLDSGEQDKTKSVLKCVEYSHSNLSGEAQRLLLCLAPFKGFIDRADLPNYAKQLQGLAAFEGWEFEEFEGAIDEAVRWGLLSPYFEGDDGRLLKLQPVFPYFLRAKLAEVDEGIREGVEIGFKEHYRGLAGQYKQMMQSKEPEQRKLGLFFCQLEYENLFSALQTCLARQESLSIYRCLDEYSEQKSDPGSKLLLAQLIQKAKDGYSEERLQGEAGWEFTDSFLKLGNAYLKGQQYEQARSHYQDALDLLENVSSVEQAQKKLAIARLTHQLGIVAQALREYEEARSHYQQALDIKIEFKDRYSQASTYHQLGRVAQALREYEEARSHYQQALDIYIEFKDRYEQAGTYHQLGIVAQALREYEEARSHYQQALNIFIEYKDRYSQASTYHQLGIVAQKLREYEEARSHYQQALDIKIEFKDRYSQASTYHQLGIVAQALREYEEARSHYQEALDIFIEYKDRYSQASTFNGLGVLANRQERYEEAKEPLLKALEIYTEFSDEHNARIVLNNLKDIYQATQEASLLSAAATACNSSVEEIQTLFSDNEEASNTP
ncbi:MAG: tetratricopeptide repeat protein, partial [Cyanobacteria bacterium P01_F01_bin.53]